VFTYTPAHTHKAHAWQDNKTSVLLILKRTARRLPQVFGIGAGGARLIRKMNGRVNGCTGSCHHRSVLCSHIPEVLHHVEFPWYRQLFLLTAAAIYFGDVGLDIFVAYEHRKHYLEGHEDSRWYYTLTLVFVVLPSAVINFVSWGLYVWCYVVNTWPQCRRFLRKKSRKLKERFCSDLIYINYWGVYSPVATEAAMSQRSQQTSPTMIPLDTRPLSSLRQDLDRLANQSPDNSYSIFEPIGQQKPDDETDAYTEFKAIDNVCFIHLVVITLLHIIQLGLIVRIVRLIYLSSKSRYSYYRYYDLTFLRLIEAFLESAPQLILQLYIYVIEPTTDPVYRVITPISMIFSVVSLALAITDYHSAGKDVYHYMFDTTNRLSWMAYFIIILWQLSLVVSRALAFSFFAVEFELYLFLFLLIHFIVIIIWIYCHSYKMCVCRPVAELDQIDSIKPSACYYCALPFAFLTRNCCLEVVIAAFNSFFFFKFTEQTSKVTWFIYYLLQGVENFTLISLFFAFTDTPAKWNYVTGFVSTFLSFFLGIGFMAVYYCFLHPSLQTASRDEIDAVDIQDQLVSSFYGNVYLTFTMQWLFKSEDEGLSDV